jgi:hypothetical protein
MVGPRPDGTSYGKEEGEALKAILPSLRRALVASKQREADRRRESEKLRSMRLRIAQISNQIAALKARASAAGDA